MAARRQVKGYRMFFILQVLTVLLASIGMAMALAHALELPGKLRLDKETYLAIQPIYYPGFTVAGGIGEGLGMIATLLLLVMTPAGPAFWWTLVGLVALVSMHATYWIVTHPVNKFWLKEQDLKGVSAGFFGFDPINRGRHGEDDGGDMWKRYRDQWEYSHVLRAVLSMIALIALIVAVAL
jgi:hypothetical protein